MTPSQQSFTAFGSTLIEAAGVEAVATLHANMGATGLNALTFCSRASSTTPSGLMHATDGRVTYRDNQHLSASFAAALAPHMSRILSAEIVDFAKPKTPAP